VGEEARAVDDLRQREVDALLLRIGHRLALGHGHGGGGNGLEEETEG